MGASYETFRPVEGEQRQSAGSLAARQTSSVFSEQIMSVKYTVKADSLMDQMKTAMLAEYFDAERWTVPFEALIRSYEAGRIRAETAVMLGGGLLRACSRKYEEKLAAEKRHELEMAKAKEMLAQLEDYVFPNRQYNEYLTQAKAMFQNCLDGKKHDKNPTTLQECVIGPRDFLRSVKRIVGDFSVIEEHNNSRQKHGRKVSASKAA